MAAVTAIQHNPAIIAQYQRLLKRGKCKMSTIGAAMCKVVHICFGVIKQSLLRTMGRGGIWRRGLLTNSGDVV